MFYLANPIFIVWFVRLAADIIQKQMTPEKANKWMEEHMFPFYPLGDLKDK